MELIVQHHTDAKGITDDFAVANEATAVMVAGSDTTSTTLNFLSYLLASHPECQKRLDEELDAAFPDPEYLPTIDEVYSLPYLDGVVKEAMRLYP